MKPRDGGEREDVLGTAFSDAVTAGLRSATLEPGHAARLRERVMDRITADPRVPLELVTVRQSEGEWTSLYPLVERKILFEDPASRTRTVLLRLAPSAQIPPHGHAIHEECLVLAGALSIGTLTLTTGDYHVAPAGVPHPVVSSASGALIFLRQEMR